MQIWFIAKALSIFGLSLITIGFTYSFLDSKTQQDRPLTIQQDLHPTLDVGSSHLRVSFPKPHRCQHDLLTEVALPSHWEESPIEATQDHEIFLNQHMQTANWKNIRIKADYLNFKASDSRLKQFVEAKLMKPAIAFLQSSLRVYPATSLTIPSCSKFSVSKTYKSAYKGFDIVIFVVSLDSESAFLARAASCQYSSQTTRPIAGYIEFNLQYLSKVDLENIGEQRWFDWINVAVHELTHVLGFSQNLFPYFVNSTTNARLNPSKTLLSETDRSWIVSSKVVSHLKKHYNCKTASKAPLEDEGRVAGTVGSHWEKATFGNDLMTTTVEDTVMSVFTFALLESSGWYLPDYSMAQHFNWGKGDGCGIILGECSAQREFCSTEGGYECTPDFQGIAGCFSDTYTGQCKIWKEYSGGDCLFQSGFLDSVTSASGGATGPKSRCFKTTLLGKKFKNFNAGCFNAVCESQGIKVYVDENEYYCSAANQVLNIQRTDYSGTITCPDVTQFCNTSRACPNLCSGVGTCKQGQCICWKGYSGDDCSQAQ